MQIFDLIGVPIGYVMSFIYNNLISNYFVTIFILTFLVRLLMFPLSLKQQKSAMDRAKLAPRLERLQKKYANDRTKLAEKQQELYQKHGVSMTGGCMPMLVSMVILFGVISVIYAPLTNLATPRVSDKVVSVAQQALIDEGVDANSFQGYYGELRVMLGVEQYAEAIKEELADPSLAALQRAYGVAVTAENEQQYQDTFMRDEIKTAERTTDDVYNQILTMSEEFKIMGTEASLLDEPFDANEPMWNFGWLWIIPLISGLTSFGVSFLSMHYNKRSMPKEQVPGQGCTNNMMMIYMPAFSTFIAFTVPGAVGIYWIFSNLISLLQTVILNKIYDPAKARAEAEAEYLERRRKKEEDKKRLAKARQREEAEARKAEQELERQREESREMNKNKKKKKGGSSAAVKTDDSQDNGATDAVEETQTAIEADVSVEQTDETSKE